MNKKIIVRTKSASHSTTQTQEEHYNAYVSPNTEPIWDGKRLYTGEKAPGWMIFWRVICVLHFIDLVSDANFAGLDPLYLVLSVSVVLSVAMAFGFSLARNPLFRHFWVVYIGCTCLHMIVANASPAGLSWAIIPSCFAVYLYKSKKVALYLNYKKSSPR